MPDALDIGQRVLDGGARGRAEALRTRAAAADDLRRLVRAAAVSDAETGHSAWGRASRIARRLRGLASERHVRRLLKKNPDAQGLMSDFSGNDGTSSKHRDLTHEPS